MFRNTTVISKYIWICNKQVSSLRNISIINSNLYPRNINKDLSQVIIGEDNTETIKEKIDYGSLSGSRKDEDIANEIEANLFENSSNKYNPPKEGARQILKKYEIEFEANKKIVKKIKEIPQKILQKENVSRLIEDNELGISYTRLDLNHPLISKILMNVRSKKHRDKSELILIEGRRLFLEAVQSGLKLQTVIFSQKDQIALVGPNILKEASENECIYKIPQHDLKIWSSLSTPPGLIGIFKRPSEKETELKLEQYAEQTPCIPVTVVCDNIREPNNLGSIIRTAAAVPCSEIVILKGCCDPWEPKALRGGCGGQFRIRIRDGVKWEKYMEEIFTQNSHILISESNLNRIHQYGFDERTEIYSEVNICGKHNHYFVIIGGETHGVSENIYLSISKNKLSIVKFLHIPLANGVESLNATTALSLILFDLRNKYLQNISFEEDTIIIDNNIGN